MKLRTQSNNRGDKPQSASFKQRMVASLSVCFLSSAVSEDEGKSSSSVRPTQKVHRNPKASGPAKKRRGRKGNIWKRRMDRCPVAVPPPSATMTSKPFWKVFSRSKHTTAKGTTAAFCPPKATSFRSSVPISSRSRSVTGVLPKQAMSQAQPPALAGVKATTQPGADSTFKKGGMGGVSVRNSLHGSPVTQGLSHSTPAAVPVNHPALERLKEFPTTHAQPVQGEGSVMPSSPQDVTTRISPASKPEPAALAAQPSSSLDNTPEPPAPAAQPGSAILMSVMLLVAVLLGWYWVRTLRSARLNPAEIALPPTQAPAFEDSAVVGLRHHRQPAVFSWLECIIRPWIAVIVCCGLLFCLRAGRHFLAAMALGLAAAAVARHMAAAVALRVSKLWAAATAVEVLLKGSVAALLTFVVLSIVALLASLVLGCLIQAVECCMKDTDEEATSAAAAGPEEGGGRHAGARKSTSSTSSSGSSRHSSSSSNRSCDCEKLAPTWSQPASRQGWFWGRLFSKNVNVGNNSDESLIKALHTAPADMQDGHQDQNVQPGDKDSGGVARLPQMACGKGCAGLSNPSSNCYANAVLQCLTSFPEWSWQFYSGSAATGPGQPKRPVTAAMTALQRTMWASKGPVNPMRLLRVLGGKHAWWQEGTQQDCNNFLLNLLEKVQEVNWVVGRKPYKESLSGKGTTEQQANEAWMYCRSRSRSPIEELFTGQLQTSTTCGGCKCGHQSLHFDDFQTLSLKFPDKLGSCRMGFTLQELLAWFSSTTHTEEYKCGKCGKQGASNQLTVCRWPPILVLQLARFRTDEAVPVEQRAATIGKVTAPVSVPDTLIPSQVMTTKTPGQTAPTYELQGVVDHVGSLLAGHYTARCRSAVDNSWHLCNDSKVDSIQYDGAPSPMPYLLFYRRKD